MLFDHNACLNWAKKLTVILITITLVGFSGCQFQPDKQSAKRESPPAKNDKSASSEKIMLDQTFFVPELNQRYIFNKKDGDSSAQLTVSWKADGAHRFRKDFSLWSGEKGSDLYSINDKGIVWLESSYIVPQSEGDLNRITKGVNMEMKYCSPGSSWTNQYQETDAYGNLTECTSKYTFIGFKKAIIMGVEEDAAVISWQDKVRVLKEAEDAPLGVEGYQRKGESWYVKGLGLVRNTISVTEDNYDIEDTMELVKIKKS